MPRWDVERWGKGVEGRSAGVRVVERYRRGCFPVICTIEVGREGRGGRGKSRSDKSLKSSAVLGGRGGGEKRRRHVIICANLARGAAITLLFYTRYWISRSECSFIVLFLFFWFVDTRFSAVSSIKINKGDEAKVEMESNKKLESGEIGKMITFNATLES